jgi:integrase
MGADMANQQLNEKVVQTLQIPARGNKLHYFASAVLQGMKAPPGFAVRVTANGNRAFVLNYRHRGRERRITIGQYPTWSALAAVREARTLRQRIDRGEDPLAARAPDQGLTVGDVLDRFVAGYVKARAQRSGAETIKTIDRLVRPAIGRIGIHAIKRSDVMRMLDRIAEQRGPSMSDRVLAIVGKCFGWWSLRDDTFVNPIVRGMRRVAKNGGRKRILSDDEIKRIWHAADSQGVFGQLIKFLLLSCTRRNEAAGLHRAELLTPDTWLIGAERYKTNTPTLVPLSSGAQAVIARLADGEFPFAGRGGGPFRGFARAKTALDKASGVTGWVLHDLRRTARSLLSRVGTPPHIAEQCLGHKVQGVAQVYDRHSYEKEKREALEALSRLVAQIVGDCHG